MNPILFEFFESSSYIGFRFLKSKNENPCGDNSLVKDTEHFSFMLNCDGVSTTSSPEKSSTLLVEAFENHFKSMTSKKPRLGKITELILKKNKEYLKKNLASTLDLFVFSKNFNYYIGLGDSSFYIFDSDVEVIFQNWIHNQSKIIEDHFESKIGDDHVLVNCVGIQHPRFEMAENIKIPKNSRLLFHSDGIEQFFNSPEKIHNYCSKIMDFLSDAKTDDPAFEKLGDKSYDKEKIIAQMNEYFKDNYDDLSLVFCILK